VGCQEGLIGKGKKHHKHENQQEKWEHHLSKIN
jgi:hypothetical protein